MGGRTSTTWTKETAPKSPGRPPLEKSLTKALRDFTDPKRAAAEILALTESKDETIRLRAWQYIFDRLDGTPIQSLRTQSDDLPQIVIAGPETEIDKADSGDTTQEATP